jgi:GNAT superfamily N-acetyltransferase
VIGRGITATREWRIANRLPADRAFDAPAVSFALLGPHHSPMKSEPGTETVTIRPATRADLDSVLEHRLGMIEAVFSVEMSAATGRVDPAGLRESNRRWLEEHLGRDFLAWIADAGGRAVASAAILWFDHPPSPVNPGGREAYILNVFTEPRARRRGLARLLMERLVEEARAAGVKRVWLRASDEGRPLYELMGFRPSNYLQLTLD